MNAHKLVVFFDGICVLCNRAVKFLIWLDCKKSISFSTLDSPFAQKNIGKNIAQSIVVMDQYGMIYKKSNAIRIIANQLFLLRWIGFIIGVLPVKFTDFLYGRIAKHRYWVFGKYDSCPLIDDEKNKKRILF
jgi:predicted DCC family thiol-disulfide oxidoreductase YuxK